MTLLGIFPGAVASALVFFSLAGISAEAQLPPAADHHAHLQSAAAARLLNERKDRRGEPQRPCTASQLIAQLDAAGIRRAVALSDAYRLGSPFVHVSHEAAAVDAENEWTLREVQMYPDRLLGFCSVNPLRPYALAAIEHCAAIGLRGGLKIHLANASFRFYDPAHIRQLSKVFAAADGLQMPILIHLRNGEIWHGGHNVKVFMQEVLPSATHIPVQIAHLGGWGGYDRATDQTLSAFARACEEHPDSCRNLYFDISAVVLSPASAKAAPGTDDRLLWDEQKGFVHGPERLAENLRRIGLSRILFGTDWSTENAVSYIDQLKRNLRLTPVEIAKIFPNIAPYFSQKQSAASSSEVPGRVQ